MSQILHSLPEIQISLDVLSFLCLVFTYSDIPTHCESMLHFLKSWQSLENSYQDCLSPQIGKHWLKPLFLVVQKPVVKTRSLRRDRNESQPNIQRKPLAHPTPPLETCSFPIKRQIIWRNPVFPTELISSTRAGVIIASQHLTQCLARVDGLSEGALVCLFLP